MLAVVTLVLGGALTLAGQWLADQRTARRESRAAEQRRADMRADELRQTLFDIQDQMAGLADTVTQLTAGADASLEQAFSRGTHRIRLLLERVPEQRIRESLLRYLEAKEQERRTLPGARAAAADLYAAGQTLLGEAIRELGGGYRGGHVDR